MKGARSSPCFMPENAGAMDKTEIIDAIGDAIVARKCFIVEINVSKDNDVEIVMESEDAEVRIEDCEAVSEAFESRFDRDKEDYSITVSSAGLDRPFAVLKQYVKAIGTQVEVLLKGGRKLVATLTAADEDGITLRYSAREAVEGRKTRQMVEHEEKFAFGSVNAVYPHIEFRTDNN